MEARLAILVALALLTAPVVLASPDEGSNDASSQTPESPGGASLRLLEAAKIVEQLANDPMNEALRDAAAELPPEVQTVVDAVVHGCRAAVEVQLDRWAGRVTDARLGIVDVVDLFSVRVLHATTRAIDPVVVSNELLPVHVVLRWQEEHLKWTHAEQTVRLTVPAGEGFLEAGNGILTDECDPDALLIEEKTVGCEGAQYCADVLRPADGWYVHDCNVEAQVLVDEEGNPARGWIPSGHMVAPGECLEQLSAILNGLLVRLRAPPLLEVAPGDATTTHPVEAEPVPADARPSPPAAETIVLAAIAPSETPSASPAFAYLLGAAGLVAFGLGATVAGAWRRR